jgi:formate dehydrogenase subunit beta
VDCVGTYEPPDYQNTAEDSTAWTAAVLGAAREGNPDSPNSLPYRPACQICETPAPWSADIALHTIGVDTGSHVLAAIEDDALAAALGLEPGSEDGGRSQVVESLIATRRERRQANLDEMAAMLATQEDGTAGLLALFETCQRCHNCTTACPICYCKQCLFQTRTFEHEPRRFYGWAARKGAARLPGDTIAFQLTRLSHVTTSCVGCGLCTSACPADLPVDRLFQTVARETQALFEYVPGRDLAETLPTATFRKDEFVEIGERG